MWWSCKDANYLRGTWIWWENQSDESSEVWRSENKLPMGIWSVREHFCDQGEVLLHFQEVKQSYETEKGHGTLNDSHCAEKWEIWGSKREPEVQHFGRQTMGSRVSAGGWAEGGRRGSAGRGLQGLSVLTLAGNRRSSVRNGRALWLGMGMSPCRAAGRAGEGRASWDRVKGGARTAAVTGEEEKCQMNLFPVYNENTPKQIFILIKNIHIKSS